MCLLGESYQETHWTERGSASKANRTSCLGAAWSIGQETGPSCGWVVMLLLRRLLLVRGPLPRQDRQCPSNKANSPLILLPLRWPASPPYFETRCSMSEWREKTCPRIPETPFPRTWAASMQRAWDGETRAPESHCCSSDSDSDIPRTLVGRPPAEDRIEVSPKAVTRSLVGSCLLPTAPTLPQS